MAILIVDDYLGHIEAVPRYTNAASGDLIGMDNAIINAVADPIKGIVVNDVPVDNPPSMLKLAGKGCIIEDTVMDGVTAGNLVWSDGDGTYSVTAPVAGAAGTLRNILGVVRRIDTRATDTGCQIEITCEVNTDAVT